MGPRGPGKRDDGSLGDREQPRSLSRLLLPRGHPAPPAPLAGGPSGRHGHPQGNNILEHPARVTRTRQLHLPWRHGQVPHACTAQPCPGLAIQTHGLCPALCSLTPSTLPRWAGSACLASAGPGSCCSLPASLSSAAQHCPTRTRTPGHSHTNASAHCAVPAPSHPPSPCPCPLLPVACPLQGAAGQADGYLWPLSPPAVAHGMAKGGFPYRKALPSRRMRLCQT